MTVNLQEYNDQGGIGTATNTALVLTQAIADIHAPRINEILAGTQFACATENWGDSSDAKFVSRKSLCDLTPKQILGSVDRKMDDLELIVDSPQTPNSFLTKWIEGSTQFVVGRYGMSYQTTFAVGQTVTVWQVVVATVDWAPITNTEGELFRYIIKLAYRDRAMNVKIVA